MWRAVDSEGEVLDALVQPRRDTVAALKLVRTAEAAGARADRDCYAEERKMHGFRLGPALPLYPCRHYNVFNV